MSLKQEERVSKIPHRGRHGVITAIILGAVISIITYYFFDSKESTTVIWAIQGLVVVACGIYFYILQTR
jgi:hypothetical protein